jgi:hypothetical protein
MLVSRHFFPGGNTPGGFFSYFGNIPFHGERTIYVKGTSGSGKSTFMKRAAAAFEARGFAAEYFHCSNDPGSLDGACVPGAGLCIVDGTAPHVQDPAIPVARDEIFNLAAFIDPCAVEPYKDELIALALQKKQSFDRVYGYIAAARAVQENNSRIHEQFLDRSRLNAAILDTLALLDGVDRPDRVGRTRRLFAGALTPEGFVDTLDSLMGQNTVYALRGEPGMGTDVLLERVRQAACLRGLDCECLCRPLDPGKPEHLTVPALGLGFFTADECPDGAHRIDFHGFLGEGVEDYREEIEYNNAMFGELANRAVHTLAAQRAMHDRVEEIYMAGMDFDELNRACDEKIERLLESCNGNR